MRKEKRNRKKHRNFLKMIDCFSQEKKDSIEVQFVAFSDTSIQERQLFWTRLEGQMYKKEKLVELLSRLELLSFRNKNYVKKLKNAQNFTPLMWMFLGFLSLTRQVMKVSVISDLEVQVYVILLFLSQIYNMVLRIKLLNLLSCLQSMILPS